MQYEQVVGRLCMCGLALGCPASVHQNQDYTRLVPQMQQLSGLSLAWVISVHWLTSAGGIFPSHGLSVCIPPKFICWNPNVIVFWDGAFGRQLDLDEDIKMKTHDGISALVRRRRDQSFLFLCPVRISFYVNKLAVCKTGREPWWESESAGPWVLDFRVSRTIRKFYLVTQSMVYYYSSPNWLRPPPTSSSQKSALCCLQFRDGPLPPRVLAKEPF